MPHHVERLPARPHRGHALARAAYCLAHPLGIAAAALLIANALWLQPAYPGWVTGKIGDFAWLFLAPFLFAAAVGWLVPARSPRYLQISGLAGLALAGATFTLAKTVPAANGLIAQGFTALAGYPAKLTMDPSDLLALPALWAAWRLWTAGPRGWALRLPLRTHRWARAGAVVLVAGALLADAPNPRGFYPECIVAREGSLYGFTFLAHYLGAGQWNVYQSDDGGLNWRFVTQSALDAPGTSAIEPWLAATPGITATVQARDTAQAQERAGLKPLAQACQKHDEDWTFKSPAGAPVQYRFSQGKSISRSADGGETWQEERPLKEDEKAVDALVDPRTGNLVVAIGDRGILVRTPDGSWHNARSD